MVTVKVNVERLVRLQRRLQGCLDSFYRNPHGTRKEIQRLREEIDSIILGKPENEDAGKG